MQYVSTEKQSAPCSFKDAVLHGLAPDGGLFVPENIPLLEDKWIASLRSRSLKEIALHVVTPFVKEDIPQPELERIIDETLNFEVPLVSLNPTTFILELFHGPTMAFKDFGARFLGQTLSYFSKRSDKSSIVLVATSGDTGGAVASGMHKMEGVEVVILYPADRVSPLQELQITSLGDNITALRVNGSFDDCQALVKQAFNNAELTNSLTLTTANSINIARLLPQTFYYFFGAALASSKTTNELVFSVPSGNLGNLTAGLFAQKMGLKVKRFIAATNANNVFGEYLKTGEFTPRESIATLASAMDVGAPSNFRRIEWLFNHSTEEIRKAIVGRTVSDDEVASAITSIYSNHDYLLDPHTAVGLVALRRYLATEDKTTGIALATAHPAKFIEVVEPCIDGKVELPEQLRSLKAKRNTFELENSFDDLIEILLARYSSK